MKKNEVIRAPKIVGNAREKSRYITELLAQYRNTRWDYPPFPKPAEVKKAEARIRQLERVVRKWQNAKKRANERFSTTINTNANRIKELVLWGRYDDALAEVKRLLGWR